jgi:hypothetical protein
MVIAIAEPELPRRPARIPIPAKTGNVRTRAESFFPDGNNSLLLEEFNPIEKT